MDLNKNKRKEMRKLSCRYLISLLLVATVMNSCSSWSNHTNGTILGSIGGAVVGAGIGGALGDRHSAHFGAHLGSNIGAVVGGAIGAEADAKKQQKVYSQEEKSSNIFVDDYSGKRYYRLTDNNVVLFQSRDSQLNKRAKTSLKNIAGKLKKVKGTIYIYGSTDNVESRDYSHQLSLERAKNAASYLISLGVSRKRIKIHGLGDTNPIADNNTMYGRERNRSVEIYVELK